MSCIVSSSDVSTDPGKVAARKDRPIPKDLKELQASLGPVGYYQEYLKNDRSLNRFTAKGAEWEWDEAAQVFVKMQKGLTTAPVLGYPDPDKPYLLDTDANNVSVGAAL